jgi:putative endonuclease
VYIIKSKIDGTFYKGSFENPFNRLEDHNSGMCRYTSGKVPWELVYVEELSTKRAMLIREKKLKRGNAEYFEKLIAGKKNILNKLPALSRSLRT